ncbi:unknown protein encoded by prophage CP-933N [Escherichia coli O157:H7 str. EDL933]|uniref:Uncharacterized protein n=1 Tax=Escherichia coli O157:H7 TaxID=83334 RepID=Q8X3R5_ECO57|nr:unknown protein encoded by prophage CP-933N [Escherichia coli O157:H7 str. EDL933]
MSVRFSMLLWQVALEAIWHSYAIWGYVSNLRHTYTVIITLISQCIQKNFDLI